MNNLEV